MLRMSVLGFSLCAASVLTAAGCFGDDHDDCEYDCGCETESEECGLIAGIGGTGGGGGTIGGSGGVGGTSGQSDDAGSGNDAGTDNDGG